MEKTTSVQTHTPYMREAITKRNKSVSLSAHTTKPLPGFPAYALTDTFTSPITNNTPALSPYSAPLAPNTNKTSRLTLTVAADSDADS